MSENNLSRHTQNSLTGWKKKLKSRIKHWLNFKLPWKTLDEVRSITHLRAQKYLVKINQPLVLISQIQRSGGTLLSQLFDGHPQLHAHPYELRIGNVKRGAWPRLNIQNSPEDWFRELYEPISAKLFRYGFSKHIASSKQETETFPFLFMSSLQRTIFMQCVSAGVITSQRDIFDCYMTSYFNSWLDNQNLYGSEKKYVTGFAPGMNTEPFSIDYFYEIYPDGKLISLVRDPQTWFVSVRKMDEQGFSDIEYAIKIWVQSAQSTINFWEKYGSGSCCIIKFEDLLINLEPTMRYVCNFLAIEFDNCLLVPTFNRFPIKADSSFKVQSYGVITDPLFRSEELTIEEKSYIEQQTLTLYKKVCLLAEVQR